MKQPEKHLFMIRNSEGLFSSGGSSPRFGRYGKVWDSAAKLKCHLAMFRRYVGSGGDFCRGREKCEVPADWEVVEIEYVERGTQNARELALQSK